MFHVFHKVYWVLPVVSAIVWFGMLVAMLVYWIYEPPNGRPHLPSMSPTQTIAYISDVGATILKPLFIAGSATMVVCLDLGMIAERWMRHTGKLAPNTSWWQKGLSIIAIIAAIAGGAGIILLSIFDTLHHPKLHDDFLILFIVGYVVSAIFICAEFQRLGIHYRQHRHLRMSFWVKLLFIVVEVVLAIAFGTLNTAENNYNVAACLEWTLAFVFTLYILTFVIDLWPAASTKHHFSKETLTEAGFVPNGSDAHGAQSGYTNGYSEPAMSQPGRNF